MADYHPLIARAVAGLEKNTGEARRALYERARTALVAQLRGVAPALQESEITRERLALEEAIRKVEAESARQSRFEQRPTTAAPRIVQRRDVPEPEPAPVAAHGAPAILEEPPAVPEPPPEPPPRRPPPRREAPPVDLDAGRRPAPIDLDDGRYDAQTELEAPVPPPAPRPPRQPDRGRAPPDDRGARDRAGEPDRSGRPDRNARKSAPLAHDFDQLEPASEAEIHAEAIAALMSDKPSAVADRPTPPRARPQPAPAREEPEVEAAPRRRTFRLPWKPLVAVAVVVALCFAAYWQRDTIMRAYHTIKGPATQVAREAPAPSANTRPKIADRVGGDQGSGRAGASSTPGVAQRVVLYDEDPADPQGKRYSGSVIWRTETVSAGPGQPPELAIKADIEIPERRMAMTFSLRRNTDKTLPASHTIEVTFNLPADFDAGGISNVPGVLMKQQEQTRGTPLAGLAVKVTTNFFLIGLSAVEVDFQRNIQLLKERAWFDIPIVYNNTRRAILAMEKGNPGDRAFEEAFAAWKQ